MRKQRKGPQLGDVIEIETPKGLAYAQYSHEHPEMGSLIRVLPGLYRERPTPLPVHESERFFIFYPVDAALREGMVSFVGNEAIPTHARSFPLMRNRRDADMAGRAINWWLWDGNDYRPVDTLSKEQRKLSIAAYWSHDVLVERIATGWSPEDEEEAAGPPPQHEETPLAQGTASPEQQALEQMGRQGWDLSATYRLTHYLYFGRKRLAARAAEDLRRRGWTVEVNRSVGEDDWLVLASHETVMSEDELLRLRDELEALAASIGGEYDGWEVEGDAAE